MSFQDLKSLFVGVVMVCGVMLAGPLTSHASPVDPFAVVPVKAGEVGKMQAKAKPRVALADRFAALLSAPKISQKSFDLTAITSKDYGDWDQEVAN